MYNVYVVTATYEFGNQRSTQVDAVFATEADAEDYMASFSKDDDYYREVVPTVIRQPDVLRKAEAFGLKKNMNEDTYIRFNFMYEEANQALK